MKSSSRSPPPPRIISSREDHRAITYGRRKGRITRIHVPTTFQLTRASESCEGHYYFASSSNLLARSSTRAYTCARACVCVYVCVCARARVYICLLRACFHARVPPPRACACTTVPPLFLPPRAQPTPSNPPLTRSHILTII